MLNNDINNLNAASGNFTETDLKRANIVAQTFVDKVETTAPVRIGSTADEKNSALKIRELFYKILGLPSRMEPFTVRPLAGRYGIPILGAMYALALANYIIGVLVTHPVSYMFLAFAIIITFFDGMFFAVQVILNKNTFNFIYPKRTSYNVLSTIESRGTAECTLVLGGHYDSDMDRADIFMFMKDKNLPKWLSKTLKFLALASVPTLFAFAVATICLPSRGASAKAYLFLIPTIFSGMAIFYLITYFSYKKRNSSIGHEGLQGAALSLAVADYLRLHPDLVPDNCRIVLANFGCKECGAKGSEQFIAQHYGRDDKLINPVFINIAKVGDCGNTVVQGDKQFRTSYDLKVCNLCYNTLKECGFSPDFAYSPKSFTDSTPFAEKRLPTATLELKIGDNELSDAYTAAFKGAANVSVAVLNFMKKRQEEYKGTIVDDINSVVK